MRVDVPLTAVLLLSVWWGGAGRDGFKGEGVGQVGGESRRTVDGGVAVERGVRRGGVGWV